MLWMEQRASSQDEEESLDVELEALACQVLPSKEDQLRKVKIWKELQDISQLVLGKDAEERAKRLLHRLGLRRPKLLLWRVEEHWDGQGLSDRRACLAIILAEAFLLNRIAVLPRFTLSAQHNGGRQLLSNLLEYVSLEPRL
eukprot:g33723.t1